LKYPANDVEVTQSIKKFISLFRKDCRPALEESNEFFQMKKIQLKSSLAKDLNGRIQESEKLKTTEIKRNSLRRKG